MPDDLFGTPSNNLGVNGQPSGPQTPASKGIVKAAGGAMDLLNRPHAAVLANRGTKLQTLIHGNTPEQQQQDENYFYNKLHIQDRPNDSLARRGAQWLVRQGADILTDPLTPLSIGIPGVAEGRTLGGVALHQAERYSVPAVLKVIRTADRVHPKVGQLLRGVHDLGVDSDVKRVLAEKHGTGWHRQYAQHYRARNAVGNRANEITRSFRKELDGFLAGKNRSTLDQIFRAVDNGTIGQLPHDLQAEAHRFQTMTQAMEHIEGSEELHEDLVRRGYGSTAPGHLSASHAPEYARRFISDTPRNLQGVGQSREHYVPQMREARDRALGNGTGQETEGRNLLSTHDPHLMERSDNVHYRDPETAIQATKNRIGTMARAVAAHDVLTTPRYGITKDILNEPAFREFYMPTYVDEADKTKFQHGLDIAKAATDFEKAGVFMTPAGHMARIGMLAAIDDPAAFTSALYHTASAYAKAVPKAVKLRQNLGEVEHEMRSQLMQQSIADGAVQTQSVDRHSPFIEVLGKPGELARMSEDERIQKLAKVLDIPKNLFEASGHILWHFDDEVKHAAFTRRVKNGMDPAEAALEVGANLVDYTNRSGLAEKVSPIVPFSTWRTKMPLAVIRGMIKRPALVSEGSRAEPAAFGGEQNGYGSGLPYADFNRMIDDPSKAGADQPTISGLKKWGRGSLAPWIREPLDFLMHDRQHWWTGGAHPLEYITNQIPIFGNLESWSGNGPYKDSPHDAILQSLTTLTHSGKKGAAPWSPAPYSGPAPTTTTTSQQSDANDLFK